MSTPIPFSEEGYLRLLEAFLARGYAVRDFADAQPHERHLVLRHDIDLVPEAALPIARIEQQLGLHAHYFVLLTSELYNAFAPACVAALHALRGMGHRVGLHFDASVYRDDELDAAAARECAVLEQLSGGAVTAVSYHRPAPSLFGRAAPVAGRLHTYQPRFVQDMGYCSDSRGQWRHGSPLEHPVVTAGRALQLLTHPIWWTGTETGAVTRLDRFLAQRCQRLDAALAANVDIHVAGRLTGILRGGS